jgi:hypothetical protein
MMFMTKAISVTLDEDNVVWLRARAAATTKGSLSEVLDTIVTSARLQGQTAAASIRSVVGTIDLPDDDPDLSAADTYVRGLFDRSARRPVMVKDARGSYGKAGKRRG